MIFSPGCFRWPKIPFKKIPCGIFGGAHGDRKLSSVFKKKAHALDGRTTKLCELCRLECNTILFRFAVVEGGFFFWVENGGGEGLLLYIVLLLTKMGDWKVD